MTYRPVPIDTAQVELSPEILELAERLAENVHDVWAQGRLADGWRYGPRRDDVKKEHPGLVRTASCPSPRSSTTAPPPCRPSRRSWRSAIAS